jgi:DNA polymerase
MLIDLIEHLEAIPDFELIQSNTDGLIVSLPDTDKAFELMDDICWEWETRCSMELEFDEIDGIWQKDVNNYVFRFSDGRLERKGAYVKELSTLDYDLPIVNEAVVAALTDKVPPERTIMGCNWLMQFQQVKKASGKYKYLMHGDRVLKEKTVRCFASKDRNDGGLVKVHALTNRPAKVENTPEHVFLVNDNVTDLAVPDRLDRQWYIDLANKRLADFGVI